MLDFVTGTVRSVKEKSVTIEVGGMGLSFQVPQAGNLQKDSQATLHTYMHWNAENGPSLFGFATELERRVFTLVIDCPKIGPNIAISILSHFSASQFLEIVTSQDEDRLSQVNGIGAKKAEQLIVQLKHKVSKLLSSGEIVAEAQESFVHWQNVTDVLTSLNYSKQEISGVVQHLSEKYASQNVSLDQLVRAALGFLTKSSL